MLPVTAPGQVLLDLARRSEDAGIDELWVAEDLGMHGGVALAASVLAVTDQVPVGLGIAPAAARHPAFLAMQAATLAQLHPGRFMLGIGHGMPGWMKSLGIWPASPLARLEETLWAVRGLLAGERVRLDGSEVVLDDVALATTPAEVPLYAGVRGPRSLAVAGRLADGLVLAGWAGPDYIARARRSAETAGGERLRIVASARFALDEAGAGDGPTAHERLAEELEVVGPSLVDMLPDGTQQVAGSDPAELLPHVAIAGDIDDLEEGIARWHEAGADVVLLDPHSVADVEAVLESDLLG
jgi:alkanesulfonate monooxygenase SsuD/methylene tetrahydromethanopterin reductase-like flavin-dependent oxidoreductase (luciferase family)